MSQLYNVFHEPRLSPINGLPANMFGHMRDVMGNDVAASCWLSEALVLCWVAKLYAGNTHTHCQMILPSGVLRLIHKMLHAMYDMPCPRSRQYFHLVTPL